MSAKANFLARLQDEINAKEKEVTNLKEAFNYNSKLPDSFFDSFFPLLDDDVAKPTPPDLFANLKHRETGIGLKELGDTVEAIKNDYGKNRKLVIEILKKEGRAMLKQDLLVKFEQVSGKEDQSQTLTNAISGLTVDKVIKGYKPQGLKFRGNYWGLITWFDGEKIKSEHEPPAFDYIKSILG